MNAEPQNMASEGMEKAPKRVFIKTYGCQMNVYDSDRMVDALAPHGYLETKDQNEADLIVLNTCHIREKASEKVFSELGRLKTLRDSRAADGKPTMIGVAGCVAQAEGDEIIARAPMVDLVFGPQSYHKLPELLERAKSERLIETDFADDDKFDHLPAPTRKATLARGYSAFLTVQEGCDKFCTFCVVPYTRGAEVSRPVAQVLAEARELVSAGVREITLLGQNVNAYHGADETGAAAGLASLLYRSAEIEGLDRLRYTTSHPRDMDRDLIAAHRDLDQLMPYLHLPIQSGSDAILKSMNRRHTRNDYLRLVDKVRAARPDIALSGDFIVGFPGESDKDFADTMRLIEEVGYASAFSFKYSPRPGTPGADMNDQVEPDVASERLAELQDLLRRQQAAFNQSMLGREIDVLLERRGRKPGQLAGRSPYLQAVHLDAPADMIGSVQRVRVRGIGSNSLDCTLVTKASFQTDRNVGRIDSHA